MIVAQAKHTPGPWEWRWKDGAVSKVPELCDANGAVILSADIDGFLMGAPRVVLHGDNASSNSALIVAAPDLEAALQQAITLIQRLWEEMETPLPLGGVEEIDSVLAAAKKAIAKALGEEKE